MKKGKPLLTEAFSPEAFRFMYLLVSLLGVCPLVAPVIEPYMKLLHVYALAVLIRGPGRRAAGCCGTRAGCCW